MASTDKPPRDDWADKDGGWFPPQTVPTDNVNDYREWAQTPGGWAMVEAAVIGGSGMSTDAQAAVAAANVSAQSLVDGGAAFQRTYDTLSWLETFVRDHSKAIAGEGKPWQGAAANAFLAKMEWFAKYIGAHAERIAGSDGTGGIGSIPNQLSQNANWLAWAQKAVKQLDSDWATYASKNGVSSC
jgi:collagen type III alpha